MTLLSICIPTYNRADLLEYCLQNLRALDDHDIDYEIVIVDHASTDHTPQVIADAEKRWNNIRSYRQEHPVGIERQVVGCLRAARGKFTVYVADDDKIIPEKLVEYVRFLDENPSISAVFTPWYAYDDAAEKILHGYFTVPQRTTFKASAPMDMLQFITSRLAFPEIGIYRSECLQAAFTGHPGAAYVSFALAYSLLRQGDVVFESEPFYLEVAITKPQFKVTSRVNIDINVTHLDNIRAGAEIVAARMLMDMGHTKIPDKIRANMHELLLNYAHNRLIVAFDRAMAKSAYLEASEYAQRVILWRGLFRPDLTKLAQGIYALTGLQAAAQLFAGSSWLSQFYIHGFHKPDDVINAIRKVLPDAPLEHAERGVILAHAEPEKVFVLVKTREQRAPFLDSALLPGHVVSLEDMAHQHAILPGKLSVDPL